MKNTVAAFCALSCALGSLSAAAQAVGPWTLEQCIAHAVEHNLQVKQTEQNVRLGELTLDQSKLAYVPSVGASVGYNASFGRSLDQTTYQFIDNQTVNNVNGGLQLSTQLFAGMGKLYTLKRSELNLASALQTHERTKNDVMLAVAAAYLQVLYSKEQAAKSEKQIAVIDQQIDRTKKLVAAGSVPMGSLLDLESQRATEQYNLVTYRNQVVVNTLTLTQLLELRSAPDFEVVVPDVSAVLDLAPSGSVDEVFVKAQALPQIKGAQLDVEAADKALDLARSKMYPTLNATASYGSSYSDVRQRPVLGQGGTVYYEQYPFVNQIADNASAGIALTMNIPIFNSLNAQRGIKTAKVERRKTELTLLQTSDKLYKEIAQAWADATGALDRYRSARVSVAALEESFRYAEQRFAAGAIDAVEYSVARNNLIAAESSMIQAKWEYVFKTKILDFYSGIPITL